MGLTLFLLVAAATVALCGHTTTTQNECKLPWYGVHHDHKGYLKDLPMRATYEA